MIFPNDYEAPDGLLGVISFYHYKMKENVAMFSNGKCLSSISKTKGVWVGSDDGYTRIYWLSRPFEILTPSFGILNMAKNGLPIVEASGRLGNQYIWLAYALAINADSIVTDQKDLLELDCGHIRIEYKEKVPFDGKSWVSARKWINMEDNIETLRSIIAPGITQGKDAIALHVRMGDKIGASEYLQPSRDFYERALSLMPKDLEVNVFSDNIKGCKEYVKGLRININYIHGTPREDFLNIYSHTHHIIPDTTFSWMASLISPFRQLAIMHENPNHGYIYKFPELLTIKG